MKRYSFEKANRKIVAYRKIFCRDKDALWEDRKYDCLVRFLDSAIRFPFQVHPTKKFSRNNFNSEYGKTKAWLVAETRENAKLYFGVKDKITKEELSESEERSEIERYIMGNLLYGVDVKVGDVWLMKAGLIHALRWGTVVEVQEHIEFTIQTEHWYISYEEEYIGLDKSTALNAINYDIFGDKAVAFAKVKPKVTIDTPTYIKEKLTTYRDTPCFGENRHIIRNGGINGTDKALLSEIGKWVRANKGFIYNVRGAQSREDDYCVLEDENAWYIVVNNVVMTADPNVTKWKSRSYLEVDKKIKGAAYWLDSGESTQLQDGKLAVLSFGYGTSLSSRVAKALKK